MSMLPSKETSPSSQNEASSNTAAAAAANQQQQHQQHQQQASTVSSSSSSTTNVWLDPPNVNRYKLDMEQAHAMRRRFKSNSSATQQQQQQQAEIKQLEDHIQLGLQALDQADQLQLRLRNQQPQQAFELYQRAIELLLRCIKSPLLSQSSFDSNALSARLQVALSDAERIKQQLQDKKNNLSLSSQQQSPFESTQEAKSPTSNSLASWQSMLSALSNALTPVGATSPTTLQEEQAQPKPTSQTSQQPSKRSASSRDISNQPHDSSNHRHHHHPSSSSRRPQTRSSSTRHVNQPKSPTSNTSNTSPRDADALVASLTPLAQQQQQQHQPRKQRSTLDYTNDPLVRMVKTELYVDPTELSKTTWNDISGLDLAKRSLQESAILPLVRPDLFTGLRRPHNILLYGPPGTGKTMLVRAVAYESKCLLFACSASTLTSKWLGEGEKLVKTLFRVARDVAPSLVFLDELDALLSNRKSDGNEHEASRRFKTEFMIQMDGVKSSSSSSSSSSTTTTDTSNNNNNNSSSQSGTATTKSTLVLVVGCTNCPWDVDAAVLRRFPKRIYIPLPDDEARRGLLQRLLQQAGKHTLTSTRDVSWLVQQTAGCSGSDLTALASEASFGPLRSLSVEAIRDTPADQIRPITRKDFEQALAVTTKSVPPQLLAKYQEWEQQQS